jgi:hypothetical protein
MSAHEPVPASERADLAARHLVFGWRALAFFLALGLVLEALHGFKLEWYLGVEHESRRLLLRLAHTHGTLLGLVHLAFAFTLRGASGAAQRRERLASKALTAATALLPLGFLAGGLVLVGPDPNPLVLLAPVGGLLLLVAVLWIAAFARASSRRDG